MSAFILSWIVALSVIAVFLGILGLAVTLIFSIGGRFK